MKKLLALLLAFASTPAWAQVAVTAAPDQAALLADNNPQLAANKKVAYDFWRTVIIAGHTEQAGKFMAENYIQHNPAIPSGRAGFLKTFSTAAKLPIAATVPGLVTILAERDLVTFAFVDEEPVPHKPGKIYTTTHFDMFRISGGKVAEHWDDMHLGVPPPLNSPPIALANASHLR